MIYKILLDTNGTIIHGSMFGYQFGGQKYSLTNKLDDIKVPVNCTLCELYNGCSKVLEVTRTMVNPDGRTTSTQKFTKMINIMKGGVDN